MAIYFNRYVRENHLMLFAVWERCTEWIENEKGQLDTEEKKRLKTACTHIKKVCDSLLKRQDTDYADRLLRSAKNMEFIIRESRTIPEKIEVAPEELYNIADYALLICQNGVYCKQENHRECELYKTFLELNIPVCDCNTDGCPYRMEWNNPKLEEIKDAAAQVDERLKRSKEAEGSENEQ